jgi:hypothetical protein
VTLIIRTYPLDTFFVLACGLSWIQESPLGREAPFSQAEKAGGDFGEISEVSGVRSSARSLTTSAIKED